MAVEEPEPDTIWVECPHCGQTFPTHDVGDVRVCIACDERFMTFQNIVDEPDFPEWKCPHCHRLYDEKPEACKCQRDGKPWEWLWEEEDPEQFLPGDEL